MQIKKEPWYKRLFDKILVSCFLSCRHEWEVLEVLWTAHDYSGFKYDVCRCGCKKCIKKMDREQKRIAKIKLKSDKKLSNMSI